MAKLTDDLVEKAIAELNRLRTASVDLANVLQMAVDYHTLGAEAFEKKYPIRPLERDDGNGWIIPCWVELAREALNNAGHVQE